MSARSRKVEASRTGSGPGRTPRSDVDKAARAFAEGQIVVVSDDEDRENEADLIMAAEAVDEASIAFMVRHTGGVLCVPMTAEHAKRLELAPMVAKNDDPHGTAFTVSVDHVSTGTGISAADRAATIRALADPVIEPDAFRRPGHVFPLVARRGGVLKRAGHTEAAVGLARLAGTSPVAVISELVTDGGNPLRQGDAARFAAQHRLVHITIADLQRVFRVHERLVERGGESTIPTQHGTFRAQAYRSLVDGVEHLALAIGDVAWSEEQSGILVRMHSECLTGDVFGSQRCDCGAQLQSSLQMLAEEGRGVLVYLRGHEGRGIGLSHKLRAYSLQDRGLDTVDANVALGLPVDSRDYGVGAHILADLGVRRIRLLTNNPAKYSGLAGYDLEIIERVALRTEPLAANLGYLATKQRRLGHDLGLASSRSSVS